MNKKKVASLMLVSAMLFSASFGVIGCKKTEAEGAADKSVIQNTLEEIDPDSLWFDYSQNSIQVFDEALWLSTSVDTNIVETNDGFATSAVAAPYTYEQIHYNYIVRFDEDGNLIDKVEIDTKKLGVNDDCYVELMGVVVDNGNPAALVCVQEYDEETYDTESHYYRYNVITEQIESLDYFTGDDGYISSMGGLNSGYTYAICTEYDDEKEELCHLVRFGKDGELVKTFDASKEIGGNPVYELEFLSKTNDTIMLEVTDDKNRRVLSFDTTDWSVTLYTWQEVFGNDEFSYANFMGEDGKIYFAKEDGVYCSDNKEEPILPYTSSYADITKLSNAKIITADGEHFVLVTVDYSDAGISTNAVKTYIHIFNLADQNPNAGKSIITVGYIDELYPDTSSAISSFNMSSDDYYVMTKCYSANQLNVYSEGMTSDDYKTVDIQKSSEIANELAMDLLNGEGPDVILNVAGNSQLNSDAYLLDLASFVDENFSDVDLFDNVIDAGKIGDKLYQVPLTFSVEGIWAEKDKVKGETGFTFPEYEEYVSTVCNGNNPLAMYSSKLDVLSRIMSSMPEQFYDEDGNIDFQNDIFYEIAKYCKDKVSDFYIPESNDYYYSDAVGYGIPRDDNTLADVYDIDSYLRAIGFNPELSLYGIPSVDGRGPSISIESSVAVSTAASDVNGAKELVKFLVKWDQNTSYTNSVCVDVTNRISQRIVDNNNRVYDVDAETDSPEMLRAMGCFRFEYDVIDDYISILRTASTIKSMDPSIMLIVREEIQAYFAGQKSIEDVAYIIQDRAQIVIDER